MRRPHGGREPGEFDEPDLERGRSDYLPGLDPGGEPDPRSIPAPRRRFQEGGADSAQKRSSGNGGMRHLLSLAGLAVFLGCSTLLILQSRNEAGRQGSPHPAAILPTIVIDPGHGGIDEGASSNGLLEKDLTLDVGLRLEELLHEAGYSTLLTRRSDVYVPLSGRAYEANLAENALFISIHFNQSPQEQVRGVETFYADEKTPGGFGVARVLEMVGAAPPTPEETGESLAAYLQTSIISGLQVTNRGIKSRNLYVVRNTRCPAVLVEGGFISNKEEAEELGSADYRQRLAAALLEGIVEYENARGAPLSDFQLAKVKQMERAEEKTSE